MVIQLSGVTRKFGRTIALKNVSLRFEPGQIICILGPNAAGKTTLLKCIAGLLTPTRGHVSFDGQVFNRNRLDLRKRFMFLPDFPFLFWDASILQNIGMLVRLYDRDSAASEEKALALLKELKLIQYWKNPLPQLSRGQIYKTALAGLLTVNPEAWILDEPFASGMDPLGIATFRERAKAAVAAGGTIIYSTQILDVAERFADRICVIHRGEIHAFDTMDALRAKSGLQHGVLEQLFKELSDPAGL